MCCGDAASWGCVLTATRLRRCGSGWANARSETGVQMLVGSEDTRSLLRRGLLLEFATLGWNVVGTVIMIVAAARAHSIALAGFGLDSLIEILASLIVIWQLRD